MAIVFQAAWIALQGLLAILWIIFAWIEGTAQLGDLPS